MPFSIIKKIDHDSQKANGMSDKCVKELQNLEKCSDKKEDCTEFYNAWIKCNEQPILERKS